MSLYKNKKGDFLLGYSEKNSQMMRLGDLPHGHQVPHWLLSYLKSQRGRRLTLGLVWLITIRNPKTTRGSYFHGSSKQKTTGIKTHGWHLGGGF